MSASEQDRARSIHGGTRTLGVIGWPVEHSLSPAIHNAAFRSMGLPWVYLPLPVAPGTLPQALAGLVALGFEGANVTMPHKTEAADLADELTEDARLLGAANTLTVQNGAILGDNTDAPGFERFLRTDAGFDARGARALLFGAGGAARAVALALARSGVAALTVAAREPATAMAIVELLDGFPVEVRAIPLEEATGSEADLVVNATPVGADGVGTLPAPALGPTVIVVDLLYRSMTPLLASAERAGATSFSGLGPPRAASGAVVRTMDRTAGAARRHGGRGACCLGRTGLTTTEIPDLGYANLKHPHRPDDAAREMDDYSALAQRIGVTVSGVRGSLILSRDGLVLGSFPENDEGPAKSAWLKFVTLGEPDKSFVEFPDQVWAFVKRGPYAAFSVAEPGTRPGILVDQMEQVLLAAEEGRSKREAVRLPDAASAPSGKPRTSLHPAAGKPQAEEVVAAIPAADEFMEAPPGEGHWRRGPDASEPSFANSGGDASATDPPLTASEAPSLPPDVPRRGIG